MVISSPCLTDTKNWLVHKQTACGKDISNPLIVDSLPKIVGFSTHLASCCDAEEMRCKYKNAVKNCLDTILKSSIRRNLKLTSEVQV
ncbi:hypothetical protein Tco_0750874 [Tanacetum coccineum]|uniref:Uncharacterized protein n=1 Tax=Tanacetum coccineum TaxID=301880 RepID=A0ABQ4Z5W8_9ASTR